MTHERAFEKMKGRVEMRLKRVLGLVLALAMVMSVVPAFSITAGAAEAEIDKTGMVLEFDGGRVGEGQPQVSTAWATNEPIENVYKGWTQSTTEGGVVNVNGHNMAGTDRNVIQLYRSVNSDKTATFTIDTPGYAANAERIVISWNFHRTRDKATGDTPQSNASYGFFRFYDIDDNETAYYFMDKNGNNVPNNKQEPHEPQLFGWPDEGAKMELEFAKNEANNNWDVNYYVNGVEVNGVEPDTWNITTEKVNGFKKITAEFPRYNGQWNNISFGDLKIYAEYAENIVPVTATYTYNGEPVTTVTKTYDTSKGETGATFPQKAYSADGSNEIYYAEETILDKDGVIEMIKANNTTTAVGTIVTTDDGRHYQITEGNIIPNGDFKYGLDGWLQGCSAAALSEDVTVNGDGTVTMKTSGDSNGFGCLYRSFAIEPGATYIYKFTSSNEVNNLYHKLSLSNELGRDEAFAIATDTAAGNKTTVFTNSDNYKYAKVRFRWCEGKTFGNFELCKAERVKITVTVNYVNAEGTVLNTKTINDVLADDPYTFADIEKSYPDGEKTLYYDEANSSISIEKLAVEGEKNVVTVKYVEDKPKTVNDLAITTRVGVKAVLPETVTAIGAQNTEFHDVAVTWNDHAAPVEKVDYKVTGYLTNFPDVTVTANVTVKELEEYLVASYSFEGDGTNDVKDAYKAEILGECSFENGIDGKGVRFPSNATHNIGTYGIKLGGDFLNDPVIQETKEMTLTMYIKQEGGQIRYARVFDFGGGDGKDDIYLGYEVEGWLNHLNANSVVVKPRFDMFPSSNGDNDQWSQFVMTMKYDGEKTTIKLYSNGEAITSRNGGTVLTDPIVMELPYDATTKFAGGNYYLGASNWKDPGFRGWMDEVKIYGAAMEESEIKALYENRPQAHTETIKLMFEGNKIGSVQYPNVEGKSEIAQCYAGNVLKLDEATPMNYTAADGTVYVRDTIANNEIVLADNPNDNITVNYVKAAKLTITNEKSVTANGVEYVKDGDFYYVPLGAKVTIEPADGFAAFVKDGAIIENTFTADGDAVINGVKAGVSVKGAQVRIAQGVDEKGKINKAELKSSGLRFVVEIDKTDTVAAYAEGATYGVEIVPADAPNTTPADIKAERFQNDDKTIYTAALVNLSESNYNRRFTAKPYMIVGENKYYGESLDRSIYEVSAGLMKTDGEITGAVYDVLNAYLNQVGVRVDIDKETGAATADDVYTGDVFFTVTEGVRNEAGYYTVTVVLGDGFATKPTLKTDWWTEYVRVNNNNSQVRNLIPYVQYDDEAKTLKFVFDPKHTYAAE